MSEIKALVEDGKIVIAAGGGGIPVSLNAQGVLEGIEGVIDTEKVACMVAREVKANVLLIIVDREDKFIRAGLTTDKLNVIPLEKAGWIPGKRSDCLQHRSECIKGCFGVLHSGGEQVMISSLSKLSHNLARKRGLRIGTTQLPIELFQA